MKARFEILRHRRGATESRWQRVEIELPDENATVATALAAINARPGLMDAEGAPVGHVAWDCSCLQKKCGACAMRIDGLPRLACDTRLSELGAGPVRLEPLKKQSGERTLGTEAGLTGEKHAVMTGGATLTLHGELIPILGEDTFGFGKLVNLDLNLKSLESLTAGIREDGARDIGSSLLNGILTENVSDLIKPE